MSALPEPSNALSGMPARFTTTHWTVILSASRPETSESAAALERLCRTYWQPLYAYVRRRGYSPHDAQDLTQSFFARLIEKDYLRQVDRSKGKFRSFLLVALEHFLANEWRNAHVQKRGGKAAFISLDDTQSEQHYSAIPAVTASPEKLFEQQWATALLGEVLTKLRQEFAEAGKGALFAEIKRFLTGDRPDLSYAELALQLQTTEAAIKMAVSRMRHRYGELLRAQIAETVSRPEDIDEELRALFAALSA